MDKAKLKAGKRNKHKQTIKNNNNTSHLNNISQLHCRAGIIQLKKGRLVHSNFTCTCQDHRIERYPQTEWTGVMDFQSAQLTSVNRAHTHTLNIPKLSIFVQMPLLIHPNPSKSIQIHPTNDPNHHSWPCQAADHSQQRGVHQLCFRVLLSLAKKRRDWRPRSGAESKPLATEIWKICMLHAGGLLSVCGK